MKKLGIAAIIAAASLSLTACGSSSCKQFARAKVDLSQKGCVEMDRIPDPQTALQEEICDQEWEAANDEQRSAHESEVEAFAECVDKVAQCDDENQQASYEEAVAGCPEPQALPKLTRPTEDA